MCKCTQNDKIKENANNVETENCEYGFEYGLMRFSQNFDLIEYVSIRKILKNSTELSSGQVQDIEKDYDDGMLQLGRVKVVVNDVSNYLVEKCFGKCFSNVADVLLEVWQGTERAC